MEKRGIEERKNAFIHISDIFDRLQRLTGKEDRLTLQNFISDFDVCTLCSIVNDECGDKDVEARVAANKDIGYLTLIPKVVEAYLRVYPDIFASTAVIWIVGKVIALIKSREVFDKVGIPYLDFIVKFLEHVSSVARQFILGQIISILHGVACCKKRLFYQILSPKDGSDCDRVNMQHAITCFKSSIKLSPIEIDVPSDSTALKLSLLYLLQHAEICLDKIEGVQMTMIWFSLIRMTIEDPFFIKIKTILVMQRLLSMDVCCCSFADELIELFFVVEKHMKPIQNKDVFHAFEALATCERTFGMGLRRIQSKKTFQDLEIEQLLRWTRKIVQISSSLGLSRRSLLELLSNLCFVASKLDFHAMLCDLKDLYRDVASSISALFARLLDICDNWINVERLNELLERILECFLRFIINTGEETRMKLLSSLLQAVTQSLTDKASSASILKMLRRKAVLLKLLKRVELNDLAVWNMFLVPNDALLHIKNLAAESNISAGQLELQYECISICASCQYQEQQEWIAFIMLPWLSVCPIRSRDSLVPFCDEIRALSMNSIFSSEVIKSCSLKTMTAMKVECDWRCAVIEHVLDTVPVSIGRNILLILLDNFHHLALSIGLGIFLRLISRVVRLSEGALEAADLELCAGGMKAIARAFEAVKKSDLDLEGNGEIHFVLHAVLHLVSALACHNDKDLRLSSCAILNAVYFHLNLEERFSMYEEQITKTLVIMKDFDEDVRNEYAAFFTNIIGHKWCTAFDTIESMLLNMGEDRKYSAQLQFTMLCALHASHYEFNMFMTLKLVLMSMHPDLYEIIEPAKMVLKEKARQCYPAISVRQYFLQNKRFFVRYIAKALARGLLVKPVLENNETLTLQMELRFFEFNVHKIFKILSMIFMYTKTDTAKGVRRWLVDASSTLVPYLIVYRCHDSAVHEVFKRVVEFRCMKIVELIEESFSSLLTLLIDPVYSELDIKEAFRFIGIVTGETHIWLRLMAVKAYECYVRVLQNLSVNEERCFQFFRQLAHASEYPTSDSTFLTSSLKFSYLGILLRFRSAFMDHNHYEEREIIIDSLCRLMERLKGEGTNFLDTTAGKMLAVLRETIHLRELAIPAWRTFIVTLSDESLLFFLPRIIVSIGPLFEVPESKDLLELIFLSNRLPVADESFERIALVLWKSEKVEINQYLPEYCEFAPMSKVLSACTWILQEYSDDVSELALHRVLSILRENDFEDEHVCETFAANLIPALLHTISSSSSVNSRLVACIIMGKMGAIDPGRIGLSSRYTIRVDRRPKPIIFVESFEQFMVELTVRATKSFSVMFDASLQEECAYSIQILLHSLFSLKSGVGEQLWESLDPQCRREIAMFRFSKFARTLSMKDMVVDTPLASNKAINNLSQWICTWYLLGSLKILDNSTKKLFVSLYGMVHADASFARFIMPHLIIQAVIEKNSAYIEDCKAEMISVFQTALSHDGWPRFAAHTVFSILDCLERYRDYRAASRLENDEVLSRISELINTVLMAKSEDGNLYCILAAEKCQCVTRALRWCEQYGILLEGDNMDQKQFYTLERLYSAVNDVDGVLGAYATVKANWAPAIQERILALEASGNFWDAITLYEKLKNEQMAGIRCLLRLNESRLALNSTFELVASGAGENEDEIRAVQLEATWRLKEWCNLERLVDKGPSVSTWGAGSASLLCDLRRGNLKSMNDILNQSRSHLAEALTAMTVENSDTYSQAYKYVVHLHILNEIEEAATELKLDADGQVDAKRLAVLLEKWQKRYSLIMQHTSVIDPILTVRRGILNLARNESVVRHAIVDLYLQSSRIFRVAGNLQLSWNYFMEAKFLDENGIETLMEEARICFAKGHHSQAVSMLISLADNRFPKHLHYLQKVIDQTRLKGTYDIDFKNSGLESSNEDTTSFIKLQLLLTDYQIKSGSCSFEDLYIKYKALPYVSMSSEDLYYRVAIFIDNYICLKNLDVNSDKILLILRSYTSVLIEGRSHLFHVMPRMLTVWLDFVEKLHYGQEMLRSEVSFEREKSIKEMNAIILNAFNKLDLYIFYAVFAQLISRITHNNIDVFNTLKTILSKLLVTYPHQCLWQSIAVFRSDPITQKSRYSRCRAVYELAKRTDSAGTFKSLISQYEYIATSFIRVAEDKCPVGTQPSIDERYPYLSKFFSEGFVDPSIKLSEPCTNAPSRPEILVPLREMLQHAIPIEIPNSLSQFPVNKLPNQPQTAFNDSFTNIYIHEIEEEFEVIKSMVRPKKITIVASDGNRYSIMCKAKDELRKDSRLMDISRLVNTLLRQNPEARHRQLSVRTYNVIPLQDSGGLIEWIPNLSTFRSILTPLIAEKSSNVMVEKEWFSRWVPNGTDSEKLDRLRGEFYSRHPIVMDQWLRRTFTDSCEWYAARLAFIHTSAVMSMLGFVLGLGDRHAENLLIDVTSGEAIHVDFNLLFNKGESLNVPEVVPFRLTRNIVSGFGATGVEGAFRYSCESTMRVLKENREVLQTILQTFVHDPLLEWMHSESRAQQIRQVTSVGLRRPNSTSAQIQAQEIIGIINLRLKGHVVSPRIYRTTCNVHPMSIEGQVQKLIQLASDDQNLAKMYIGWCPFL